MKNLPVIHFDCKHFLGDRPCKPNKELGVFCGNCSFYEKDEKINKPFPQIPEPETIEPEAIEPEAIEPETIEPETIEPESIISKPGNINIIIIKLDAVGDVLRTTSILPGFKKKFPDSHIAWITMERSFEVLRDNELIDKIYLNSGYNGVIADKEYDIAVNLDSGHESCRIMSGIKAAARYGYHLVNGKPYPLNTQANYWYLAGVNDNFKKENKLTYHEIIYGICSIKYEGEAPILNLTTDKKSRAEEIKTKFGIAGYNRFILINLGGGNRWQYKKWTLEGYTELAEILSAKYPNAAVGIIAGDEDRDFYAAISGHLKKTGRDNIIYFGCDNSMEDFICIVSLADEVFTSDSLCFHIASALGKYTFVITGPTSYTELDVFGRGRVIYSEKVDCLCCYLNRCEKTVNCMNTISASEVADLFDKERMQDL